MGRAGACWLSPRTDQHRCQTKGWRRGVLECEAQRWLGGLGRHRWVFPPCSRTLCYCCHRQGSPRAEIMATKLQASCPEGHPWKWNWLLCKAQPPFSWEKASVFVAPDASRPASALGPPEPHRKLCHKSALPTGRLAATTGGRPVRQLRGGQP